MLIDIYMIGFGAEFLIGLIAAGAMCSGVKYREIGIFGQKQKYEESKEKILRLVQDLRCAIGSDFACAGLMSFILVAVSAGMAIIWPWRIWMRLYRLCFRRD